MPKEWGRLKMYKALDLAKYIVTKCVREACAISNLQLQKILYFVQEDFVVRGKPAFAEPIEAWTFGPVVRNVYYRFCGFGAMTITTTYDDVLIDVRDTLYVDPIVRAKRGLDPWDLVQELHKPGGAWAQIYRDGEGDRKVIPVELIRSAA